MTKWKLNIDGDRFEQTHWHILQHNFPNYEVFWSEFIVPMTCRNELPKDHALYIHPKKNVDADLQNISMAHYTIFRCFIVAHELILLKQDASNEAIYADRLDLIYSNFGTIIDMVSNIFFFLAKLQFRFGLRKTFIDKKSYAELEGLLKNFFDSDYDSRIQDFERTKRPVYIDIYKMADFIFDVLGITPETESFNIFSQRIRSIRNAAIHNPVIGSVNEKFIPKLDKLKKYYLWGELFYNLDLNDFVDKEQMFVDDFKELSLLVNRLWDKLIPKYREISENGSFTKLLGTVYISKPCPECKGDMQYLEMTKNYFPNSYDKNKKEFVLSSSSRNLFKTAYWNCPNCKHKEIINVKETKVSE